VLLILKDSQSVSRIFYQTVWKSAVYEIINISFFGRFSMRFPLRRPMENRMPFHIRLDLFSDGR
jgi:hypothetical protein